MDVKQWYSPVRQEVLLVGVRVLEKRGQRKNHIETEGLQPSGPAVEQPWRTRNKCCYSQKSWGSICCSLCSVSNSPLTHNPFVTLSQPFRIKCERYIFLKNCDSFVIFVLNMFPRVYVYMYFMYSWLWQCNICMYVFVCVSKREIVCVCVCMFVFSYVCVCVCVCVWERERERDKERERERERERMIMYVSVYPTVNYFVDFKMQLINK